MLIIGSEATGIRSPKDLDLIATEQEFSEWLKLNAHKLGEPRKHDVHYSVKNTENNKWIEIEIAKPGNTSYEYQKIMKSLGKVKDIPKASDEIMLSIKKPQIHF